MSFSEDLVQFGEQLLGLVDAGIVVKQAAETLGISRGALLRDLAGDGSAGRPADGPRGPNRVADPELIRSVSDSTGSVNQAAKTAGVSHSAARRVLVVLGLVSAERMVRGKPDAKRRFDELIASGWSTAAAAREVGVNERTGDDWRHNIRRSKNTRIRPDGTVVDYSTGTRYTPEVVKTVGGETNSISNRYLSLPDRLAIADGLLVGRSVTEIAAGIGKHKSTVSREVRAHRVEGLYLPYHANNAAAISRARPKQAKLVANLALRTQVVNGLSQQRSPEQISHRLGRDYPDDESMRVSHET